MLVWLLQQAEPTPHDDRGSQRLLRTGILAGHLVRAGHEVVWWTSTFDHHNRRQRSRESRRVPVEPGYAIQYLFGPGYRSVASPRRCLNHRAVARRFATMADNEPRPDIVVASVPTVELALAATEFGKRHDVPVILDVRDLWPDVFFDIVPSLLKPVLSIPAALMRRSMRKAAAEATAVCGLTDGFVDWGLEFAGRKRGELDRVFFMAYPDKQRPADDLAMEGRFWDDHGVCGDGTELTVAFVGTLGLTVDFDPVIEAARILDEARIAVRFVICGDGDRRAQIETQAAGLSNIVFPGWIQERQIHALLARADIGLVPYIPSSNYILNLPNKPAEYLAGGLAIALSLGEGELFRLLERHGCGFSYCGDGRVLVDKLRSISEQPEVLRNLKTNAKTTFFERLTGERVYGQMVAYLEHLAPRFRSRQDLSGGSR